MLKVTSIVDNACLRHSYLAQHGQSILIEDNNQKILFDTGEVFFGLQTNLSNLHISFDQISSIVISHQHFDHCGALPELLKHLPQPIPVYIPEPIWTTDSVSAQHSHYTLDTSTVDISHYPLLKIVQRSGLQLSEHIYVTGPVDGKVIEQAISIKLNQSDIVLVVGCSHPGIQSLVDQALNITQTSHVAGIVGGMHFKDMSSSEINDQVSYLQTLELSHIVPSHCTGNRAAGVLREKLPAAIKTSEAGSFGTGNSIQFLPELKFDFV